MSGIISWKIRHVGGIEIYQEAIKLAPLSYGEIAVTTAGKLQAKKIFHSVVRDLDDRKVPSRDVIHQIVRKCLEKAGELNFKTIAIPLIGTGLFDLSKKDCWEIILRQTISYLAVNKQGLAEVIVVLYERRTVEELHVNNNLERIDKFGWRALLNT